MNIAGPVAEAADELYRVDLAEFTARRDALAKAARGQGDRDSANQIKALRKPTLAAWVVNLAVRAGPPQLAALRRTAQQLRTAQAGLDSTALKSLSAARQADERAAVRAVVALAQQAGVTVRDSVIAEIESTLRALVADPAAEQAVASGRLTRALHYAGFGEVDMAEAIAPGAIPVPLPTAQELPTAQKQGDRQRREAAARAADEQAAAEQAAAEQAADGVRCATHYRDQAQQLAVDAQVDLERLRAELKDAEQNLTRTEQDLSDAESALSQAISHEAEAQHRQQRVADDP